MKLYLISLNISQIIAWTYANSTSGIAKLFSDSECCTKFISLIDSTLGLKGFLRVCRLYRCLTLDSLQTCPWQQSSGVVLVSNPVSDTYDKILAWMSDTGFRIHLKNSSWWNHFEITVLWKWLLCKLQSTKTVRNNGIAGLITWDSVYVYLPLFRTHCLSCALLRGTECVYVEGYLQIGFLVNVCG